MIRLPKTRSSARVRWTVRTSSRPSSAATRSDSETPSTSSSISTSGGSPSSRRTVVRARIRPLMLATRSATIVIASGRSMTSKRRAAVSAVAAFGHQPSEPRPAAPAVRSMVGGIGPSAAGGIVLLERERQARERLAGERRVRGREHERAVGVLGHADDAGDVHATLREGRGDAGERSRLIVELDCEPDRHEAPPVLTMVPAGPAPFRLWRCLRRSATRRPRRCRTSRCSGPPIRRRRGPRCASSASGGSSSTTWTSRSARSRPGSCSGSSRSSGRGRSSTTAAGPTRTSGSPTCASTTPEIVARLLADARLLRQPLVRHGNAMTAGRDEATWAAWLKPPGGAGTR